MNQPITPRFRAVLNGVPNLERPVQCFGESYACLVAWAEATLQKYPPGTSYVTICERFETESSEVRLPKLELKEQTK
jgi:hypothetical protein